MSRAGCEVRQSAIILFRKDSQSRLLRLDHANAISLGSFSSAKLFVAPKSGEITGGIHNYFEQRDTVIKRNGVLVVVSHASYANVMCNMDAFSFLVSKDDVIEFQKPSESFSYVVFTPFK